MPKLSIWRVCLMGSGNEPLREEFFTSKALAEEWKEATESGIAHLELSLHLWVDIEEKLVITR